MRVRVLGPGRVSLAGGVADDGAERDVELGSRKPRSIFAALVLSLGRDVTADRLLDLVWGDEAPRSAVGTLQAYISGLRRVLEPELGPRARPSVLLTTDRGYRLELDRQCVDAYAFLDDVQARHRLLAPLADQLRVVPPQDGWPSRQMVSEHVDALEQALGLWAGEPFADLPDHPDVATARAALEEARLHAEEDRALGLLALGDHATVVAATEQAVARHPYRERVWALHALALVRSGRQADALEAIRRVRAVLDDELGLDPGPELQGLEQAILRQEPALHQWLRPTAGTAADPRLRARPARRGWDTVGRAAEEAALTEVLDRATAGEAACALLVGEPGIGKTRLVEHLAARAAERGFLVAQGRCSQDDGAPPLWPWVALLRSLVEDRGRTLEPEVAAALSASGPPLPGDESRVAAFRTWDRMASAVLEAAQEAPVLLVLDDLHWADTSTLRALNLLVERMGGRNAVAVVATRRPFPEPRGALAEVGETMARHHAVRLDLTGLGDRDARALLTAVAGDGLTDATAAALQARADGNPFFLIELARLGQLGRADDRRQGRAPAELPATVLDVVVRRVEGLPDRTRSLLLTAAVLGRSFPLALLAAVEGQEPDDAGVDAGEVEAALQPAYDAGLLVEQDAGTVAFTHALTRDAVVAAASPTRVARLHARAAHALENDQSARATLRPEERVAELARHWLAAGPSHVGRAWRAAVEAAAQARQVFSHHEASSLLAEAIAAHRRDPAGSPTEAFDLLLARAGDCQRGADWLGVVGCAFEAIAIARSSEDPVRVARAAAELTRHSLWMPHEWNEVFEDTIDDLRWALDRLPTQDSAERCELMLTLAVELYYVPTAVAEVLALVDEGLGIAQRIGDAALVWWATRAAWIALWYPSQADRRKALAAESLAAARALGDEDCEAISLAVAAGNALELGEVEEYRAFAIASERIARRRRLAFVLVALGWVDLNMAAMRGDAAAVRARAAEMSALRPYAALPAEELHDAGIALTSCFWEPELLAGVVDFMMAAADAVDDGLGLDGAYASLARTGRVEDLRSRMRDRPLVERRENWNSPSTWSCTAEAAAAVQDSVTAAWARTRLRPLSGRMAVAGISLAIGPVDGYLALAEATLGNHAEATRLADRALEQAEAWVLPRYVDWLEERRTTLGF